MLMKRSFNQNANLIHDQPAVKKINRYKHTSRHDMMSSSYVFELDFLGFI